MDVEKRKISFPSLGFELQTVQPVGSLLNSVVPL